MYRGTRSVRDPSRKSTIVDIANQLLSLDATCIRRKYNFVISFPDVLKLLEMSQMVKWPCLPSVTLQCILSCPNVSSVTYNDAG